MKGSEIIYQSTINARVRINKSRHETLGAFAAVGKRYAQIGGDLFQEQGLIGIAAM